MKLLERHLKVLEAIRNGMHTKTEILQFSMMAQQTVTKALKELVSDGQIKDTGNFYQTTDGEIEQVKKLGLSPVGETKSATGETAKKSAKIRFKYSQNVGLLKKHFAFFGYNIETANITLFTVSPQDQSLHPEAIKEDIEAILVFFTNTYSIEITGKDGQFRDGFQLGQLNPKTQISLGQTFAYKLDKYRVFHVICKGLIPDPHKSDREPTCRIEFKAFNSKGEPYLFTVDTSRKNEIEHFFMKGKAPQRANFEAIKNKF